MGWAPGGRGWVRPVAYCDLPTILCIVIVCDRGSLPPRAGRGIPTLILHAEVLLFQVQVVQVIVRINVGRAAVIAEGDVASTVH